jgi:uncharacterized transporter YbjL
MNNNNHKFKLIISNFKIKVLILIFDIEVIDVLSKEQAKAEAEKVQKERIEKQKKFLDSMKNAMPDSMKKKMKRN